MAVRVEAYGTIDELNSWIGLLRDQEIDDHSLRILMDIQDRLFTIGSLLATDPEKSRMKLPALAEDDITVLEKEIDKMEEDLPGLRSFLLPGGHTLVSFTHIARCVCRRAERLVVALSEEQEIEPLIIIFLNRLSDYLFVLSRHFAQLKRVPESPWNPRM